MAFGVFVELLESNTSNVLRWIIRKITLASLLGSLFGFAFSSLSVHFCSLILLSSRRTFLSFCQIDSEANHGFFSLFVTALCDHFGVSDVQLKGSLSAFFGGDFLRSLLSFSLCFAFHRFGGKKRSFSAHNSGDLFSHVSKSAA